MNKITISKNKEKLNLEVIHTFLKSAYWSIGRTKDMVETSIQNSICFGVYDQDKQIGFARVVSDQIVFAYIMDVFILPEYQGLGHGSSLINLILKDPQLVDVQNWLLATSDAHGLYKKFGFSPLPYPDKMLTLSRL